MSATRMPRHRRSHRPSVETHNLRELCKHLQWRLSTSTHRDAPGIAVKLAVMTEKLAAAQRRDRQMAAAAAGREAQERTERQIRRLIVMRAELHADGEPCGEDLLHEMAEAMIEDGSAAEFLRAATAGIGAGA